MTTITDGTLGIIFPDGTTQSNAALPQIITVGATVAVNALTLTLSPCSLVFRSTTLTSGVVAGFSVASTLSLVIPSTATLGTVNAIQSDLYLLSLNNAGTVELAIVNSSGGVDLSETGLISTTAISAAATSASVVYSTNARTSVAYRVVGLIRSTQATAGTWVTAPSLIQGVGGQALAAMSSLGYGQKWVDVTGSRAGATTYYNTTGKPIQVQVSVDLTNANSIITATVNGFAFGISTGSLAGYRGVGIFTVPVGASYSVAGVGTLASWAELR
jgi:hypothetical protein